MEYLVTLIAIEIVHSFHCCCCERFSSNRKNNNSILNFVSWIGYFRTIKSSSNPNRKKMRDIEISNADSVRQVMNCASSVARSAGDICGQHLRPNSPAGINAAINSWLFNDWLWSMNRCCEANIESSGGGFVSRSDSSVIERNRQQKRKRCRIKSINRSKSSPLSFLFQVNSNNNNNNSDNNNNNDKKKRHLLRQTASFLFYGSAPLRHISPATLEEQNFLEHSSTMGRIVYLPVIMNRSVSGNCWSLNDWTERHRNRTKRVWSRFKIETRNWIMSCFLRHLPWCLQCPLATILPNFCPGWRGCVCGGWGWERGDGRKPNLLRFSFVTLLPDLQDTCCGFVRFSRWILETLEILPIRTHSPGEREGKIGGNLKTRPAGV